MHSARDFDPAKSVKSGGMGSIRSAPGWSSTGRTAESRIASTGGISLHALPAPEPQTQPQDQLNDAAR